MSETKTSGKTDGNVLIIGIGNVLMGDEGIGAHVARRLQDGPLPEGVTCLDGGTGGLQLLGLMQSARRIVLVDAAVDGGRVGRVRRLRPRFSSDYPRTLTAHDIGLKDLLDVLYLLGDAPDVTLLAVSIEPLRTMSLHLSPEIEEVAPIVAAMALAAAAEPPEAAVAGRTERSRQVCTSLP